MYNDLASVGQEIRRRRKALGLSQARLAHLSDLALSTVSGLENGTLADLGYNRVAQILNVIGLVPSTPVQRVLGRQNGLFMAAKTASVSYKDELDVPTLITALATGEVPRKFIAHVAHLLDEAPLPLIVTAVEEAAEKSHTPPKRVWKNISMLAKQFDLSRQKALA